MWSKPGGGEMSTAKPGGGEMTSETPGGGETTLLTKSVGKGMMKASVKSRGGEMSFATAGSIVITSQSQVVERQPQQRKRVATSLLETLSIQYWAHAGLETLLCWPCAEQEVCIFPHPELVWNF